MEYYKNPIKKVSLKKIRKHKLFEILLKSKNKLNLTLVRIFSAGEIRLNKDRPAKIQLQLKIFKFERQPERGVDCG